MSAVDDARRVAERLEIPYYVMNFKKEFKCHVMDYFVDEYLRGLTPNPCIACNRYVKWESLLHRRLEIGADYIATGHYARIDRLPNGRFAIRNSVTAAKDQTYALYNLPQDQLSHTLMRSVPWQRRRDFRWRISRTVRRSVSCRTMIMLLLLTEKPAEKCRDRAILSRRTAGYWGSIRGLPIIPSDSAEDWNCPWERGGLLQPSAPRPMRW